MLPLREGFAFVSGHGLSRAVIWLKSETASAPVHRMQDLKADLENGTYGTLEVMP